MLSIVWRGQGFPPGRVVKVLSAGTIITVTVSLLLCPSEEVKLVIVAPPPRWIVSHPSQNKVRENSWATMFSRFNSNKW